MAKATAKQRSNGTWRLRVYYGTDSTGKKYYKSFTGKTEAECYKAEKKWLKAGGGVIIEEKEKGPTVDDAIATYIESCRTSKRKTFSPRTIKEYESCRANAFETLSDREVEGISTEDIQLWIDTRADQGRSAKTIKNAVYLLKPALEKAGNLSIRWNDLEYPEMENEDYIIPTDDDIIKLLNATKEKDPEMYKAIVLAAFCGCRRSEIAALLWADLDRQNLQLNIDKAVVENELNLYVGKDTKTKAGKRTIDIDQSILAALCVDGLYHVSTSNIVNLNPTQITSRFIRLKHQFGFTFCFHGLRHYHASIMVALNIPKKYAASQMGHSTYDMIDRVYGQIVREKEKTVSKAINDHSSIVLGGAAYNW